MGHPVETYGWQSYRLQINFSATIRNQSKYVLWYQVFLI